MTAEGGGGKELRSPCAPGKRRHLGQTRHTNERQQGMTARGGMRWRGRHEHTGRRRWLPHTTRGTQIRHGAAAAGRGGAGAATQRQERARAACEGGRAVTTVERNCVVVAAATPFQNPAEQGSISLGIRLEFGICLEFGRNVAEHFQMCLESTRICQVSRLEMVGHARNLLYSFRVFS